MPVVKQTFLENMDGEPLSQETSESMETTNQTDTNNNNNQVCVFT